MSHTPDHPGADAHAAGNTLTSTRVAALPVLDRLLQRLRLDESLRGHLPHEGRRARIPTATALLVLLKVSVRRSHASRARPLTVHTIANKIVPPNEPCGLAAKRRALSLGRRVLDRRGGGHRAGWYICSTDAAGTPSSVATASAACWATLRFTRPSEVKCGPI